VIAVGDWLRATLAKGQRVTGRVEAFAAAYSAVVNLMGLNGD